MNKTAMKISGILTTIFSICLLFVSILVIGNQYNIDFIANILQSLTFLSVPLFYVFYIFVALPTGLINLIISSANADILQVVFISLLLTFSALMVFWGIKEIIISKRDDVDFANCKKTCGFMFFTKFMFFAYIVFVILASFLIEQVKLLTAIVDLLVSSALGISNGFLIFSVLFAIIALVLFLLPVANVSVVAKKVNKDSINNKLAGDSLQNSANNNEVSSDGQELQQFYKATPKPTMQANMPPLPGFNSTVSTYQQTNLNENVAGNNQVNVTSPTTQNAQPNINTVGTNQNSYQNTINQTANANENNQNAFQTTPQNARTNFNDSGVALNQVNQQSNNISTNHQAATMVMPQPNNPNPQPVNTVMPQPTNLNPQVASINISENVAPVLSEKSQADLDRLERLKNLGAITPENYEAMKKKILEDN